MIHVAAMTLLFAAAALAKPQVLATSKTEPQTLAVDARFVYWGTSEGELFRVPRLGGTATQLLGPTSYGPPSALAVDDHYIYLALSSQEGGTTVARLAKQGDDRTPGDARKLETLARSDMAVDRLACDANHLYWAAGTSIRRFSKSGEAGKKARVATLAELPEAAHLGNLSLFGNWIYATLGLNDDDSLVRVSKHGGRFEKVVPVSYGTMSGYAVHSGFLYFCRAGEGTRRTSDSHPDAEHAKTIAKACISGVGGAYLYFSDLAGLSRLSPRDEKPVPFVTGTDLHVLVFDARGVAAISGHRIVHFPSGVR